MRLLQPIMPFITEEIWQTVAPLAGKSGRTIMLQPFPQADEALIDNAANADIEWLKGFIVGVRNIRGEMNIPPGKALPVLVRNGSDSDKSRLDDNAPFLKQLAKLDTITWLAEGDTSPVAATSLVGTMEILVPMAGLIDQEAELKRLEKEIEKLDKDLARIQGKLSNAAFVDKAPADVVAKERAKQTGLEESLQQLKQQEQRIRQL